MRSSVGVSLLMGLTGVVMGSLALVACSTPRQEAPDAAAGKPFKVVTTFLPITLFTLGAGKSGLSFYTTQRDAAI